MRNKCIGKGCHASKNKFTKEEIIAACLDLVREEGKSAVTARAVAARLKSSPKVIFGLFDNMDELSKAIVVAAEKTFVRQVEIALREEKAFRAVGIAYIRFAAEEPQLFQLIFMNESERAIHQFSEFLPIKDYSYEKMILSIQEEYGLSKQLSEQLYQHLFILFSWNCQYDCRRNLSFFTSRTNSHDDTSFHSAYKGIIRRKS